jgi:hypothetical protein
LPTLTPTFTSTPTPTPTPTVTPTGGPLLPGFYTLMPCRVADTRNAQGPFGGPPLSSATSRAFRMVGRCAIPPAATAISLNVTVTQPTARGHLTLHPEGAPVPLASTINFGAGQTRANNAIVLLGDGGAIEVICVMQAPDNTVHVIIDVTGYFR